MRQYRFVAHCNVDDVGAEFLARTATIDLKQRAPNVRFLNLEPRGANITNSARLGYGLSVIDLCYTHVAKPYRLSRFSLFAITVCILIFGRSPIGDLGDFSNSRTTSS